MSKLNLKWIDFVSVEDDRGILTAIESQIDIPIEIKRIFYMHNIKKDRGGHAHIDTDQIIIGLSGSFKGIFKDTEYTETYTFDDNTKGIYVPRMVYTEFIDFSDGAVCLVLSNTNYDKSKSLRSWDEYLEYINKS